MTAYQIIQTPSTNTSNTTAVLEKESDHHAKSSQKNKETTMPKIDITNDAISFIATKTTTLQVENQSS